MMAPKPLMLKDFLEIDANSDSCDGFACAPRRPEAATVRCLLDAEFGGRLIRTRSRRALMKINAVINAVRLFTSGSRKSRFLPRSFSKRLMRREEEVENKSRVRVRDIVRLRSFELDGEERRSLYFPSPVVSSCSSSSESSGSDFLLSSCGSSECFGENDVAADGSERDLPKKSLNPNPNGSPRDYREAGAGGEEPKEGEEQAMVYKMCNAEEEEEEQLSPVSVMDFPYRDEEEEDQEEEKEVNTSPCFRQTFAHIERTRHQLLQKIRQFESIAELDPVDLDSRFTSFDEPLESRTCSESSDHVASSESSELAAAEEEEEEEEESGTGREKRAWSLLRQLNSRDPWVPQDWSIEKLLVDFFVEGLPCSVECGNSPLRWRRHATKVASRHVEVEEEMLKAASDWLGGGNGGCGADYGDAELKEMERSGRWRCFEEDEEADMASDLDGSLLASLLDELVLDLVSS